MSRRKPAAGRVSSAAACQQLVDYYLRNGVLRTADQARRARERRQYKKGYEVRLVAFSRRELKEMRRLLRAAGFKIGRPFKKVHRRIQPIYGKVQVGRFLELVRQSEVGSD